MRRSTGFGVARALAASGLWILVALLTACGGDDPTSPGGNGDGNGTASVASVTVTPADDTLTAVGSTLELSALALDASGNELAGVEFTWSSSDDDVITVDGSGVAEAVAEGEAEVTATADGAFGSAALAVDQEVAAVAVSPSSATLTSVGDTSRFAAAAEDANGHEVAEVGVAWHSSDSTVATVDGDGLATATGNGTVEITATVDQVPGHAELAVNQSIAGLEFDTQPSDATAGEPFDPAVRVEVVDGSGHPVEDAVVTVAVSLAEGPAGGTLEGTTTRETVEGVAVFDDIRVERSGTGYTLGASTSGSLGEAHSASFDVMEADADGIQMIQHPLPDQFAGVPLGESVVVAIVDEYGNLVREATGPVSVEIADNPVGGILAGTLTVETVDGSARFDDLVLERAGAGYTLGFTASGLTGAMSRSFEVHPGPANRLEFTTQPSAVEGMDPIEPSVKVEVQDTFGNRVTDSSAPVSVSLGVDPTGGRARLNGGTGITLEASEGVATFVLSVDMPGEGYVLDASSSGLSSGVSAPFSVHLTFTSIDVGRDHTCGVTVKFMVYCWGANDYGQFGDGTTESSSVPVPVTTAFRSLVATVSAGLRHTCAVTIGGGGYCWGHNSTGQLGDGTTVDRHTPDEVVGGIEFDTISAGVFHTCGVSSTDEAYCWGSNAIGMLGDGTRVERHTPALVSSDVAFRAVSVGQLHSCALTHTREAYCWGENGNGQVGDGTTTDRDLPTQVSGGVDLVALDAGAYHNCGATASHEAHCWGDNSHAQLGDGTTDDSSSPVRVLGDFTFSILAAGRGHSCGRTTSVATHCWGENINGQLGDGTNLSRDAPQPLSEDLGFHAISAGRAHTCGMTTDGEVYCWGDNDRGQLGDGTTVDRSVPVQVVQ